MIPLFEKWAAYPSEWSTEEKNLKDFVKFYQMPTFAKIRKGQFSCIGSGRRLHDVIFVDSVYTSQCIVAESQFSGKNKSVLAVPLSYNGWFDVLSEDKKHIKPISSATELLNCRSKVFLVRENTKVLPAPSNDPSKRSRALEQGEVITLKEKKDLPSASKGKAVFVFVDSNDKICQLEWLQKFSLSPVSNDDEVDGVHTSRNLVDNFCFPLTVQLACGEFFSSEKYRPIMRLIGLCNIEFAIVVSTKDTSQVLNVPLSELLTLSPLRDREAVKSAEEFKQIAKFARSIGRHQQKMISLINSGNIKVFKKELLLKNTDVTSDGVDDGLCYEDIDEIYKHIREGGSLSRFRAKDRTDAPKLQESSTPVSCRTDEMEREIWVESVYADVSKFKTLRMSKKRDKSRDSEEANIGMENIPPAKVQQMKSSHKKNCQRFKSRKDSSTSVELVHSLSEVNDFSERGPCGVGDQGQTVNNDHQSGVDDDDDDDEENSQSAKNFLESGMPEKLGADKSIPQESGFHGGDDAPESPAKKEDIPGDGPTIHSTLKSLSPQRHHSPECTELVSDPEIDVGGNVNRKDLKREEEDVKDPDSGWNVSFLQDGTTDGSTRTLVRINYGTPEITRETLPDTPEAASEELAVLREEHSIDQPSQSQAKLSEVLEIDESTSQIHSDGCSMISHQPIESALSAEEVGTLGIPTRDAGGVSKNVSIIKLGPANKCVSERSSGDGPEEKQDDVQSVKISCNKQSDWGGTLSSKISLNYRKSSFDFTNLPSTDDDKLLPAAGAGNEDNESSPAVYSSVTTIKVAKKGSSQLLVGDQKRQQTITKSPFGGTQISIRHALPTRTVLSSKFSVDRNFS